MISTVALRAPDLDGVSMAFSGVPMMVGGNEARHDERLMRQMVADFHYGQEGVARAEDLAVRAQPAPDGTVRMGPGGVAVLARHLGANGREMYYGYNDADITIPIEGTGSQGGRSDLVIAQVKDPFAAGTQYQLPASLQNGPYLFAEVVPNVDKRLFTVQQLTDKVRSAVTCAMITQPPNNRTIYPAMIRDLRALANGPQRYQEPDPPPDPPPPVVDENPWTESHPQLYVHTLNYTDRAWVNWPGSANWRVPIPRWANGVDIQMRVQNPYHCDHLTGGLVRVGVGNHWGSPMPWDGEAKIVPANWPRCVVSPFFAGVYTRPDRNPIDYSTTLAFVGAYKDYPGTLQTVRVQAAMANDPTIRGRVVADTNTVVWIFLNFKTKPEIN